MKKIIVFAAALVAAVMCQAAALDWNYGATADDVGQTVYVMLGSAPITEWESLAALEAKAIGSGTVQKQGRTSYLAAGELDNAGITKTSADVYFVVVSADKNTFGVTSVADMTASVYDPKAQESSTGANTSLSSKSLTKSGVAWGSGSDPVVPTPTPIDPSGVPEPTSGLLLLVGGAALALRRKQK